MECMDSPRASDTQCGVHGHLDVKVVHDAECADALVEVVHAAECTGAAVREWCTVWSSQAVWCESGAQCRVQGRSGARVVGR